MKSIQDLDALMLKITATFSRKMYNDRDYFDKLNRIKLLHFLDHSDTGVECAVFSGIKKFNIIVFRGTNIRETNDLKTIFNIFKTKYTHNNLKDKNIKIHRGFFKAYNSIRDKLLKVVTKLNIDYPDRQILITGHSMGGALSQICSLDLCLSLGLKNIVNYHYASPKVGNSNFATEYNNRCYTNYGINIANDPVPHIPPCFNYKYNSNIITINKLMDDVEEPGCLKKILMFLNWFHNIKSHHPQIYMDVIRNNLRGSMKKNNNM